MYTYILLYLNSMNGTPFDLCRFIFFLLLFIHLIVNIASIYWHELTSMHTHAGYMFLCTPSHITRSKEFIRRFFFSFLNSTRQKAFTSFTRLSRLRRGKINEFDEKSEWLVQSAPSCSISCIVCKCGQRLRSQYFRIAVCTIGDRINRPACASYHNRIECGVRREETVHTLSFAVCHTDVYILLLP